MHRVQPNDQWKVPEFPLRRTIFAPAKINLCLRVLGKRDDGYHDLATLMQKIDLFDKIEMVVARGNDINVLCPQLKLQPGQENLCEKAAKSFLQAIGRKYQVKICIEKKIPEAAGLGGGSSDAAAVIRALNEGLRTDLPRSELMALGSKIGADVPFFLFDQTAWATGIGDLMVPWPGLPRVWFVLVNPRIAVSTTYVFQNLGLTHYRPIAKLPKFPQGVGPLAKMLHNDLEAVTCKRYPVIKHIKKMLLDHGAGGALMSGSGPTVFGVFCDFSRAKKAASVLAENSNWWVQIVNPL